MKPVELSVCITTYGRTEMALQSLEATHQALEGKDAEILVLDDHSPGSGYRQVEAQAKRLGKARFVRHRRNVGLVANWNLGLKLARGRRIVFLGDDDAVAPGYFDAVSEAFALNPGLAFCFTAMKVVGPGLKVRHLHRPLGRRDGLLNPADFQAWCLWNLSPVTLCTVAFDTALLRKAGGFREAAWHAADADALLRLSSLGKVAYLGRALALNGYHEGQLQKGMKGSPMDAAIRAIAGEFSPAKSWLAGRQWRPALAALLLARYRLSLGLNSPHSPERSRLIREAGAQAGRLARLSAEPGLAAAAARLGLKSWRWALRRGLAFKKSPQDCRKSLQALLS